MGTKWTPEHRARFLATMKAKYPNGTRPKAVQEKPKAAKAYAPRDAVRLLLIRARAELRRELRAGRGDLLLSSPAVLTAMLALAEMER